MKLIMSSIAAILTAVAMRTKNPADYSTGSYAGGGGEIRTPATGLPVLTI